MSSYSYNSSYTSNGEASPHQNQATTTSTTTSRRRFGDSPQSPEQVAREMSSIQRQIEELDQRLATAETQESKELDKIVDDVAETTKRQIKDGVDDLASSFRRKCDDQLAGLQRRQEVYNQQHRNNLERRQEDIFKTNRVFREVSRHLREDWPHVFKILMSKQPRDKVEQETLVIEGEKPIMQAYKALVRWKELCPEEFSLERLVQVLQDSGLFEAAQKARAIMCEEGGYISDPSAIVSLPQAQSTRVEEILERAGSRIHSEPEGAEASSSLSSRSQGASYSTQSSGPISNRKLLFLSKKMGNNWQELGRRLGVPDDELKDISDLMTGDSQQCAFQMLYKWRDNVSGSDEDSANELAEALRGLGLSQQADDFRR